MAAAAFAGILILSGCTSNPPAPAGTSSPAGTSASSPSIAPGVPSKVFTDQELMAIGTAMLQQRGQSPGFMQDSQRLRTAFTSHPYPLTRAAAQPAECGAFHPPAMDDALNDLSMNFATGGVPIAGESSPTTTILFTIRSAERDRLAKADFDHTDNLVSRCAQFDVSYESQGASTPYKMTLLKPPPVGEKAYAMMSPSEEPMHPIGGVGLRVLAGTLSISMGLSVSPLRTEADAQPALNSMAGIAQQLIDEAALNPPTVAPPPPNARTPEQLTELLQSITGPNGEKAEMASGMVIGAMPGPSPSASPSLPACTFSDGAYFSSLLGSKSAQGDFRGATKMDYLTVRLISIPTTMSPPYPFDVRAAALRDCPTITEQVFAGQGTGSTAQWTSVHRLSLNVAADSTYAVAHEHPDGGVWHLLAGARKGDLSVELDTIKSTEADLQPGADAMAAVIGQVFAKAGL